MIRQFKYKLRSRIIYWCDIFRRLKFKILSTNKIIGRSNTYYQPVLCRGQGKIYAKNVSFGFIESPSFLSSYQYIDARQKGASISIGPGTWINNNAMICAEKTSITIGDACLIGFNFICVDSDFHELSVENRSRGDHQCSPILIGNNVFIGANVTILKGVSIGENTVVAAGAIVTKNLPSNVLAAGNPAKIIKEL